MGVTVYTHNKYKPKKRLTSILLVSEYKMNYLLDAFRVTQAVSSYLEEKGVEYRTAPRRTPSPFTPLHLVLYAVSPKMYEEVLEPELKNIGLQFNFNLRDEIYSTEIRIFYR